MEAERLLFLMAPLGTFSLMVERKAPFQTALWLSSLSKILCLTLETLKFIKPIFLVWSNFLFVGMERSLLTLLMDNVRSTLQCTREESIQMELWRLCTQMEDKRQHTHQGRSALGITTYMGLKNNNSITSMTYTSQYIDIVHIFYISMITVVLHKCKKTNNCAMFISIKACQINWLLGLCSRGPTEYVR